MGNDQKEAWMEKDKADERGSKYMENVDFLDRPLWWRID
jgi:hypothetical protein